MLKIYNKYRLENNIIFNSKKTVCIKFGSIINEGGSAFFNVIYVILLTLHVLIT